MIIKARAAGTGIQAPFTATIFRNITGQVVAGGPLGGTNTVTAGVVSQAQQIQANSSALLAGSSTVTMGMAVCLANTTQDLVADHVAVLNPGDGFVVQAPSNSQFWASIIIAEFQR